MIYPRSLGSLPKRVPFGVGVLTDLDTIQESCTVSVSTLPYSRRSIRRMKIGPGQSQVLLRLERAVLREQGKVDGRRELR